MADVRHNLGALIDAMRAAPAPEVRVDTSMPSLGDCPACGKPVRERQRIFDCDSAGTCPFRAYKSMSKRTISARMIRQMLADGRSKAVKGFKSKKGNDFSAGLVWDAEAGRVGFWFPEREPAPRTSPPPAPEAREGDRCPACGTGTIIRGRRALGCNRWREGCGFRA